MFHGQINVVRTGFQTKSAMATWWVGGALGLLVILAVSLSTAGVLDHHVHRYVVRAVGIALAAAGCVWLTLRLRPRPPVWVGATADHNGIFIDGAPLVLRDDIEQAYIRPYLHSRVMVSGPIGRQMAVGLPSYPLTVEIIRRRGGQLNIDPGGEQQAAALLTALGIPVTRCEPDYRGNLYAKRSTWVWSVVIVVVFIAAFVGYYFVMASRLPHHS